MIKITVDGKEIEAEEHQTLLQACLDHDIYIPNLCYLAEMRNPPASCRLCFVEIKGIAGPVTSCKIKPTDGMEVTTDSDSVRRLQRTALRLLLSVHQVDCRHCPSNKVCELQRMARFLGVRLKPKRYEYLDRAGQDDEFHPCFQYVPERCVLCGRCVFVCRQRHGHPLLTFAKRGLDTIITSFGEEDRADHACNECLACVAICPVSALLRKDAESQ